MAYYIPNPKSMHPMTAVQAILKEQETCSLRERRTVDRHPFPRPVQIRPINRTNQHTTLGFSRDISSLGIGIIDQFEREPGTVAEIEIHSVLGLNSIIRAEVRWCEPFGEGWFVTGWHFLEDGE